MQTASTVQLRSTPIARAATLSASRLKPQPAAPTSSDWATAWGCFRYPANASLNERTPRLIAPETRASSRWGTSRSALSATSQMTTTADGERRDDDHHPGAEQGAEEDRRGDAPAGHAEHARRGGCLRATRARRPWPTWRPISTVRMASPPTPAGSIWREEEALEIRGAQAAPAEQGAGTGAGRSRWRCGAGPPTRRRSPRPRARSARARRRSRADRRERGSPTAWGMLIVWARTASPTTVPLTRIHGDPITARAVRMAASHRHH